MWQLIYLAKLINQLNFWDRRDHLHDSRNDRIHFRELWSHRDPFRQK